MSQVISNHEVLTLEETADYLRISPQVAEELAERGAIPGRCINSDWRFLKDALDDWLRGPDYKQTLINQAGALENDDSLSDLRKQIYIERGRPELEAPTES